MDQNGGNLIGTGSFGCVFHPALKCMGQKNIHDDIVSKVFFSPESKKEAADEIKIDSMIQKIKGNEDWAHIWDKNCLPKKYKDIVKEDPEIETCLDDNSIDEYEFDKYRRMLQGTYAGVPLLNIILKDFKSSAFTNKRNFTKNFLKIMRLFKPLFVGLCEMYDNDISHNDIKDDNIMIDDDGCKYIDFGLSARCSNKQFFKRRSMGEFGCDRIYPSYPYEFIYLYADKYVLQEEKDDKEHGIYRDLHDRYIMVHEEIFKREKTKHYLFSLIDRFIKHDVKKKEGKDIISLIDTYSLGMLLPSTLCKIAKKTNKMSQLKKLMVHYHAN